MTILFVDKCSWSIIFYSISSCQVPCSIKNVNTSHSTVWLNNHSVWFLWLRLYHLDWQRFAKLFRGYTHEQELTINNALKKRERDPGGMEMSKQAVSTVTSFQHVWNWQRNRHTVRHKWRYREGIGLGRKVASRKVHSRLLTKHSK